MNEKFLALGSTLAAFVASLCCLGPLVLGGIGLGAALMATFAPLRPYFLGVRAVLLALGFYFVYRRPKGSEACEGEVCTPRSQVRRWANPILWLATIVVAALALFPLYGAKLVRTPRPQVATVAPHLETLEVKISGMTCEACEGVVKAKLLGSPGVAEAGVQFASGRARVKYDPEKTTPATLIDVVNSTGYKASLSNL